MEKMNVLTLIITLVVGVILTGALLGPVISDASETERTFTNEGYFTYDAIDENTAVVITWDPTTPNKFTIGETAIELPTTTSNLTIVGSDAFTCRYYFNATATGFQTYGVGGYSSYNTSNESTPVTLTITSESLVIDGTNDKTYTMGSHGFVLNTDGTGELTLKYSNESAYVHMDSEVYLCGTTFVTGSGTNDFVGVFGYGSLDDGLTMSSFYGNTGQNTVSFGDVTATYSAVNGYIDLYKLDKFEFPLTQNTATVTAVYSYFVVPTEVTAELSNHLTPGQISLMGAIPVMVIVALLMVAVGAIALRRAD